MPTSSSLRASSKVGAPASAGIFCPQSRAPSEAYLDRLHGYIVNHAHLARLLHLATESLETTWEILSAERPDFAELTQGPDCIRILRKWATNGISKPVAEARSGILALPLLTIVQVTQYFQYLDATGLTHASFLAQVREGGGGLQGYCGGLPAAVAIASSRDEAEVIQRASTAVNVVLGVGAYGELGYDPNTRGSTNIAIRLKFEGQGEDLVARFPGTHISAITDPKSISIVGPVLVLAELKAYAETQGLIAKSMEIRGKIHNPENSTLAQELCALCEREPSMTLPGASMLQVPVRSNRSGDLISESSLTPEIVNTILASRCEWFKLVTNLAQDLGSSSRERHILVGFGIGDCVSMIPFYKQGLHITKVSAMSLIEEPLDGPTIPDNAVAIIGASCRLPGANDLEDLWDLISQGRDQHKELPASRVDLRGSFRASQAGRFVNDRKFFGNFVEDIENFDAEFFGHNRKEALTMDPQQRILLELAYEAVDSSGYLATHSRKDGDRIGCFIGGSLVEYLDNTNGYAPSAYTSTGTIRAFLCGRLNHYFGWTGPSEVVDSACSSSLVAINRAFKAIQTGECTMALAGGVNIITGFNNFMDLGKAGFLSPTGQCKPFDAAADGYCRSDGAGLVFLKSCKEARAAGDMILGIIPAVATSNSGTSDSITIPSMPAQSQLYSDVLHQANMAPEDITYVEAHGTGTQAGDPVEIESIRAVFGSGSRASQVSIGSIKGNVGHCETAAGVASLLKVLTMLSHGSVPPLTNHKALNPRIPPLEPDNMNIMTRLSSWSAKTRAACINSYGAAGTNCALICLQDSQQKAVHAFQNRSIRQSSAHADFERPIIISAASHYSLIAYSKKLASYLIRNKPSLEDVALTLNQYRRRHRCYSILQASTSLGLAHSLIDRPISIQESAAAASPISHTALVFSGQSATYIGLDERVYRCFPTFRAHIDLCNDILLGLGCPSILPAIFSTSSIDDVVVLQSALVVIQYACAQSWVDSGIRVHAIIGHSLGEFAALACAGVLTIADCLKLVTTRAWLIRTKWGPEKGTMLVVAAKIDLVLDLIKQVDKDMEVACYNAPSSHVIVGTASAIADAEHIVHTWPQYSNVQIQRVDTSFGFHSSFTEPILDELTTVSRTLNWKKPLVPLETCTFTEINRLEYDRPARHAREPVFFTEAVRRVENRLGPCIWLEAGIDTPIVPMVKKALKLPQSHAFQKISIGQRNTPAQILCNAAIDLWKRGALCSYWSLPSDETGVLPRQIWLPPYQFEKVPHWMQNIDRAAENLSGTAESKIGNQSSMKCFELPQHLVTRKRISSESSRLTFKVHTACERFQEIVRGHKIRGHSLCPATMYTECVAMALRLLQPETDIQGLAFSDIEFQTALGPDTGRDIDLTLEEVDSVKTWNFSIMSSSRDNAQRTLIVHCNGKIHLSRAPNFGVLQRFLSEKISGMEQSSTEVLLKRRAYELFRRVVEYAPFFQGIAKISLDGEQAIADVFVPQNQPAKSETLGSAKCDAPTLDIFMQVVGILINTHEMLNDDEVMVAVSLEEMSIAPGCDLSIESSTWKVYARFSQETDSSAMGDVFAFSSRGEKLLVACTGCKFHRIKMSRFERLLASTDAKPVDEKSSLRYSYHLNQISNPEGLEPRIKKLPTEDVTNACADSTGNQLKQMINSYSAIEPSQISKGAVISDLGIDSLAAVEMVEELATKFGMSISSSELLSSTFNSLYLTARNPRDEALATATSDKKVNAEELASDVVLDGISEDTMASTCAGSKGPADLFQILADLTGAHPDQINPETNLLDLGVDSLSMVEMCDQIQDYFGTSLENENLISVLSTVKEVMAILRIGSPEPSLASRISAPPACQETLSPPSMNEWDSKRRVSASATSGQNRHSEVKLSKVVPAALASAELAFEDNALAHNFFDYWTQVAPAQDTLLVAYITEAFSSLGLKFNSVAPGTRLPPVTHSRKYDRLMDRLYTILEQHDIIAFEEGSMVRGIKPVPQRSSAEYLTNFCQSYSTYRDEADLMALTGPKLEACLSGRADPIAIMFGSTAGLEIMERIYFRAPMFATLTGQLVVFLKKLLEDHFGCSDAAPLRILEVGAGFGGTTTQVAEALEASSFRVEYTFTDISPRLVQKAKAKFSQHRWMHFRTFNLEEPLPHEMVAKYDIIISTNCVHATTSRTRSCASMRQMLRQCGIMVLSEVTRIIDWYDITFGLLDGWWLAEGGKEYALQPAEKWMATFQSAGFVASTYSSGPRAEQQTQQLLVAGTSEFAQTTEKNKSRHAFETMTYKKFDGRSIEADVYLPPDYDHIETPMPIALMIHGGGHMMLSRRAIRPAQTSHLLKNGILPVSIDYRLCPEVNLIDGPMTDVRDAYAWAKTVLPQHLRWRGIAVDGSRVGVVGWSSGGHLGMTLGWTAQSIGLEPPKTVLSFYAPTNFSAGDLDVRRAEALPKRQLSMKTIFESFSSQPITAYENGAGEAGNLGFVMPGDPRSELVLSLLQEGNGLSLLLCGIPPQRDSTTVFETPSVEAVAAIDTMTHVRDGTYTTPTYVVHGEADEIVPFATAAAFMEALSAHNVPHGLLAVSGARHLHDLPLRPGTSAWDAQVGPGYDFFCNRLKS